MSDFVENKSLNVLRGGIKKEKPSVDEISQGQLAVNYRKGHEALFTKNSNGEIVQINGAGGGSNFIIYRDENHDEDGIFPDKQALYDSLRDHIKRGELLFEPEDGKMCVAIVRNDYDGELETYPIVSPEPSHDSIVDPVKTKRANQIKSHPAPYGGNKIVVRRHMRIDPWANLPYYFQDGICIFRERFTPNGRDKVYTFKYDSSLLQFRDILTYHSMSDIDVEIEDIDERGCDKQVVITNNNNFTQWIMIRFRMSGYNVFEARHRIYEYRYDNEGNCFWLNRNNVKLGNVSDEEYRTRETLSPYLKLEWANYNSGSENNYDNPDPEETHKPKLVNIRPSLWRGIIDCLEEKMYPNREPGRYRMFVENVFGHDWPKPRYMIRSKMRNHIPNYSEADFKRVQQECIIPEINGGKILVHYNSSLIRGLVNNFNIDLSTEFLKLVFKTKTRPRSDVKTVNICFGELDLTKNYTEFEASDFSVFSGIQNVFSQYEIYESETICVNDENVASKYFGTLRQFKARKTNRWAHKLSGWHWCKHRKDFHIFDANRRYGGNKSYSLLLYKKHRGVLSVEPCHLSVIRTNPLKEIPAETPNYVGFDIISGGTIKWHSVGSEEMGYGNRDLYYRISTDGGNTYGDWNMINSMAEESFNVNEGDKVQFKGNWNNEQEQYDGEYYSNFYGSTAIFNVSGNILSLVQEDNFENAVFEEKWLFISLFEGTSVVDASGLRLPSFVNEGCYRGMLTNVPVLPATTLAQGCYSNMFDGCSSLTETPELPATTLANYCYQSMFDGCSSLTTAPELPAVTLADFCYANMFANCTGLTSVPYDYLPVTSLTQSCYLYMFRDCSSLTTLPELPATTLAQGCYQGMFMDCSSLTTLPELPATTLARSCYFSMFEGCSNLTSIPTNYLPVTNLPAECYWHMFENCTGLISIPSDLLPATVTTSWCYGSMFKGCTSLTTVPSNLLPATTLGNKCYYSMFEGCTGLTNAPDLPANNLVDSCYCNMFKNCTNLNYIKCLATIIPLTNCTRYWVQNVQTNSGTFVKNPNMYDWRTGENGIPSGWDVQDAS